MSNTVRCISFEPVISRDCRVLVLGSMPGIVSLEAGQYYAHPRNAFWPILYALWDAGEPPGSYAQRLRFALAHGVALWDVARTCVREGSGDASIRGAQANDFEALFAQHPRIRAVFHNGRLSWTLYEKLTPPGCGPQARKLLPSTSPAYTLPFKDKLAAWRPLRVWAEREGDVACSTT